MSKETEFKVGMTCSGCSDAVTRILKKMEGVESIECDLDAKKVVVKGTADPEKMLEKLKKWGESAQKEVELVTKD